MVNVKLPFYEGPSSAISRRFNEKMFENNAYSVPYYHNGFWWTRCSAQIWNEISDFEEIGRIWLKVIEEVKQEPRRGRGRIEPGEDPEHPY
ncbi:hypothetical protein H0H87_009845 [Tephrocybe sp. NHM501043]|nr:hypothetical protein H0H87_009845 [Tephrocybe sp. NHM501043]